MYGVYQKSVRQTEAITNLQKLVQISDSTNSHDFAHIVSPKSKYKYTNKTLQKKEVYASIIFLFI